MQFDYDIDACRRQFRIKGLNVRELARRAGVSPMSVSNFLRGISVRSRTANAIIQALGFKVEAIVKARRKKAS